ncbi:hypothetical protein PsorP6_005087 [Peronosclerospora sorghi]|uniref:Uncharacterized protein n=1 Tax=Peronosclerospora sorghi TaxID=230839 RepID=A0ACC0W2S6_9STRA|nr:hypothetical protein PsorP6_005087 [Peronosclerospora sorghi]
MRETFNVSPGIIVTDRDLALMNAISTVFPDAANLLCIWHIDKNVLANIKDKLATLEEFDASMKEWAAVCRSETPEVFEERWAALKEEQLQSKQCNQRIRRVMDLNHPIYSNVQLKISRYALFQSNLQYRKVLAASSL